MYPALKGKFENGVLTLMEPAPKVEKADILVTFLHTSETKPTKKRIPGGLKHLGGSIPTDFNDSLEDEFDL